MTETTSLPQIANAPQIRKPYIIAAIPAVDEESSIAKVILKAQPHVDKVLVCDDGSQDMTADIASALGATIIRHPRNMGYGAALRSLFGAARELGADIMVTMDADGQHDPSHIPSVIAPITNGSADIVIGSRFLGGSPVPTYKELGIAIINTAAKVASYRSITDSQSGFRAYSRAAIKTVSPSEKGMAASTEILLKAKASSMRIAEAPVIIDHFEKASYAQSFKQGFSVLIRTVKNTCVFRPTVFFGGMGLLFLAVGAFFRIWGLAEYMREADLFADLNLISASSVALGFASFAVVAVLRLSLNGKARQRNSPL